MLVDMNDGAWDPGPPDVDQAEAAMVSAAAHEIDEGRLGERASV